MRALLMTQKKGYNPGSDTIYYLPFNTDLLDHSGNNFTFSKNGTVNLVSDKANIPVCYIKGSYDVSSSTYTFGNNDFTIGYRINLPSDQDSYYRGVFGFNSEWGGLCVNYEGKNLSIGKGYHNRVFSENGFYSNIRDVWEYQVTVRDGNTFKTYRNGQLYKSKTTDNFAIWQGGATLFGIGRHMNQKIKNLYISNFILESKARTAQEILDYYNQTKSNYGL